MAAGKQGATALKLVESVEKSDDFLKWREDNKEHYLSSMFAMGPSPEQIEEWLLSYYNREDDTFTTFSSVGNKLSAKEEAFKKGKALPELDINSVKLGIAESAKIADSVRKKEYRGEEATKLIAILQQLSPQEISQSSAGSRREAKKQQSMPVWNLTFITASFSVLNVKVDAETGKVLSHGLSGIMEFAQKDK